MDPQNGQPQKQATYRLPILRAVILTSVSFLIIAAIAVMLNYDKIFPMLPDKHFEPKTYERTLVGPPYEDINYAIGEKENPILGNLFIVESGEKLTEEQAIALEKAVDGTFCGGSAHSNVYFLCLHVAAGNLEEYKEKLKIIADFDFVTGVGPASALIYADAFI